VLGFIKLQVKYLIPSAISQTSHEIPVLILSLKNVFMSKHYIPKWAVFVLALLLFQSVAFCQFTEQWVARYNGAQNSQDIGRGVVVDEKGNVYVTGQSVTGGTNPDYVTIKYDATGKVLWSKTYDGNAGSGDVAVSIAVDKMGNVYVSGSSAGAGTSSDFATVKYDANGTEQWVRRYNGPASSYDAATALGWQIVADESGCGR
jgi:hypothetical protein